jgi:hypothetical protein
MKKNKTKTNCPDNSKLTILQNFYNEVIKWGATKEGRFTMYGGKMQCSLSSII